MNSARLKYNKIYSENAGEFKGPYNTVAEDIVSILAKSLRVKQSIKRSTLELDAGKDDCKKKSKDDDNKKSDSPSFFKYTKDSSSTTHKAGDTKTFMHKCVISVIALITETVSSGTSSPLKSVALVSVGYLRTVSLYMIMQISKTILERLVATIETPLM